MKTKILKRGKETFQIPKYHTIEFVEVDGEYGFEKLPCFPAQQFKPLEANQIPDRFCIYDDKIWFPKSIYKTFRFRILTSKTTYQYL